MSTRFVTALKITGLVLFIAVFTVSLSFHEAPPEVLSKKITVSAGNENGADVTGPGDAVYHYPDILDKGIVTGAIFDERDGRFVIIKVGLWSGRQLQRWSPVSSGGEVSIEAYGFLAASVYLLPRLEVAGNREHAPEHDPLQLLAPSERPSHPPRSSWKWSVTNKPRKKGYDRVKRTPIF